MKLTSLVIVISFNYFKVSILRFRRIQTKVRYRDREGTRDQSHKNLTDVTIITGNNISRLL